MTPDIVQCPECGWTGTAADFVVDGRDRKCPSCQYVMRAG